MLALIVIHVVAVLASSLLHHENLIGAMVTGYKSGRADESIRTARRGRCVGKGSRNRLVVDTMAGGVTVTGTESIRGGHSASAGRRRWRRRLTAVDRTFQMRSELAGIPASYTIEGRVKASSCRRGNDDASRRCGSHAPRDDP